MIAFKSFFNFFKQTFLLLGESAPCHRVVIESVVDPEVLFKIGATQIVNNRFYATSQIGAAFDEIALNVKAVIGRAFALKPELIADLYRQRWQVELFFKWIKQHLQIKTFFGTTENAVKTQIWIAVCTYVLIAIAKKRLRLPNSLHEILQILSLTMFETMPINQLLTTHDPDKFSESELQQLSLL